MLGWSEKVICDRLLGWLERVSDLCEVAGMRNTTQAPCWLLADAKLEGTCHRAMHFLLHHGLPHLLSNNHGLYLILLVSNLGHDIISHFPDYNLLIWVVAYILSDLTLCIWWCLYRSWPILSLSHLIWVRAYCAHCVIQIGHDQSSNRQCRSHATQGRVHYRVSTLRWTKSLLKINEMKASTNGVFVEQLKPSPLAQPIRLSNLGRSTTTALSPGSRLGQVVQAIHTLVILVHVHILQ